MGRWLLLWVLALPTVDCGGGGFSAGPPTADAATATPDGSGPVDAGRTGDDATLDATPTADTGSPTQARDAGPCSNRPDAVAVDPATTPALAIPGDPGSPLGIYDPSLAYPPGASGGLLAYSSVDANSVHTRIAGSVDHGATFQFLAEPNQVTPVSVTTSDPAFCDAGPCTVAGVLWHEVPSVVVDPGDATAPLKLFVHTYVSAGGGSALRRDWGYVGMYTATTPGTWTPETKLLGWASSAPLSTSGVSQVLTLIPELSDCVAFTEPGAMVTALGLDLALDCVSLSSSGVAKIRVVLLRSTDHAKSFSFVSTLVAADDFACLDGTAPQLLGPDLFTVGSSEYVVVSPIGPVSDGGAGYRGCLTLPVADPAKGAIARTASGAPVVDSWVRATDGRFTGPCTYAEGATALGLLVPMQQPDPVEPPFRIFRPGIPQP